MIKTYLQITLKINAAEKGKISGVYDRFKTSFLDQINGATSNELLIGEEYFQLLYGFHTREDAQAFLSTELYNNDILIALKPLMLNNPEIRIYDVI
ncbi:hypothetical protein [Sphingobacterium sp.]|jgi:hypothetical protein|uniref:hypothetical protein n=1 Tax=Sphingobacterium sp. TaxID=341027 RepID=UPI00289B2319|nr:hypothetical protein [Sphingobacterium sp.]